MNRSTSKTSLGSNCSSNALSSLALKELEGIEERLVSSLIVRLREVRLAVSRFLPALAELTN